MKTRVLVGIGLCCAVSWSAWAEEPLDPAALGSFDGMLASCLQVNPAGKAAYEALRAVVIGEQTEATVSAVAQTPEYRQAYDAAHQKTDAEPREMVIKDCSNLAASLGPRVHQRPGQKAAGKTPPAKPTSKG
jgi:hypothetical protein